MNVNVTEILEYIHEYIPITSQLGASIKDYSGDTLSISAPLEANINHHHTVFGGSLSAIGILSGWTLLYVKLQELGIVNRLVIQDSSFTFLKPATSDFEATAVLPDGNEYENFLKIFERKGMAKLKIKSDVYSDSKKCGTHEGTYVAFR